MYNTTENRPLMVGIWDGLLSVIILTKLNVTHTLKRYLFLTNLDHLTYRSLTIVMKLQAIGINTGTRD